MARLPFTVLTKATTQNNSINCICLPATLFKAKTASPQTETRLWVRALTEGSRGKRKPLQLNRAIKFTFQSGL